MLFKLLFQVKNESKSLVKLPPLRNIVILRAVVGSNAVMDS